MPQKTEFNIKLITVNFQALKELKLTVNEYLMASAIQYLATNPRSPIDGWMYIDSSMITPLGKSLDMSRATAYRTIKSLKKKGIIEVNELSRNFIRVTKTWYNTVVGISSLDETTYLKMRQNVSNLPKEKVAQKENILYTSPSEREGSEFHPPEPEQSLKKKPTCPLLNGSPLKAKYPNGHTECVEYLTSEEDDRAKRFINRAKQFQMIHKVLKAGFGFDSMDKTIRQVEKKYGKGAWDYTTLANWLEKGSDAQKVFR